MLSISQFCIIPPGSCEEMIDTTAQRNSPDRYGFRTANGYEGGFTGEYVMAVLVDTRDKTARATRPRT